MAADRAQHVAEVVEPALDAGRVGRHRPLLGVDPRLPGLRTRPRPRRAAAARDVGHRAGSTPDLTILLDVPARRGPRPSGPARAPTASSASTPASTTGCATGTGPWPTADPDTGSSSTAGAVVEGVARANWWRRSSERPRAASHGPMGTSMSTAVDDGETLRPLGLFADVVGQADAVDAAAGGGRRPGPRLSRSWVRPGWASGRWCAASPPRCCVRAAACGDVRGVSPGPGRDPPRRGRGRTRTGALGQRRRRPAGGARWPSGARSKRSAR